MFLKLPSVIGQIARPPKIYIKYKNKERQKRPEFRLERLEFAHNIFVLKYLHIQS